VVRSRSLDSSLNIILNDIVHFTTLDPENLPAFPIMINMIALVKEDQKINKEDVTIIVKKHSVVYVNKELILTNNSRIVHIQNLSFPEFQKVNAIMTINPTQLS
ncbi:45304_t:CDS:2, partial [Gigaspora margarita]